MGVDRWVMIDERWSIIDGRWPWTDGGWSMTDDRWSMTDDRWPMSDDRWSMIDDRRGLRIDYHGVSIIDHWSSTYLIDHRFNDYRSSIFDHWSSCIDHRSLITLSIEHRLPIVCSVTRDSDELPQIWLQTWNIRKMFRVISDNRKEKESN